jgi:hypothetical protein
VIPTANGTWIEMGDELIHKKQSYRLNENGDLKIRTLVQKAHILCQKHQNQPLFQKMALPSFLQGG